RRSTGKAPPGGARRRGPPPFGGSRGAWETLPWSDARRSCGWRPARCSWPARGPRTATTWSATRASSRWTPRAGRSATSCRATSASGPLDGVTRRVYPQVERDRADLAVNGVRRRGGAAVWRTYALDFKVPFAEVDQLRLVVGFRQGAGRAGGDAQFLVDDLSL